MIGATPFVSPHGVVMNRMGNSALRRAVAAAALLSGLGTAGAGGMAGAQPSGEQAAPLCREVAAPEQSSETERRVWASLCAVGYADLSALDKEECDAVSTRPWPHGRRISAAFVKTILFEPPWRDALRGESPHLRCAEIIGDLDLSHRRLDRALLLEESRIAGNVSLLSVSTQSVVSLRGSRIEGAMDAEGVRASGDVFLRGAVFEGPVRLRGARLVGALEAQNARFDAGLSLDQAKASGPLRLTAVEVRAGPADFTALQAESLDLRGARLASATAASLRAARLGRFDARSTTWPEARDFLDFQADKGDYLQMGGASLIAWLESGFDQGARAFGAERSAYRALAAALTSAGRRADAIAVRIAEKRRRIASGEMSGAPTALWRLWDWSSGFGLLPGRLAGWAVALTALGAALASTIPNLRRGGVARLVRLSLANAFFLPLAQSERGRLYDGGTAIAAAFALQRLCGALLLILGLYAAAVFVAG